MYLRKHLIVIIACLCLMLALSIKGLVKNQTPINKSKIKALQTTKISPAPLFTKTDINGFEISLEKYKGDLIILNFWATWCPPCVSEIPQFIDLQANYQDKIQIIGISLDKNLSKVKQFIKEHKINYPTLMGSKDLTDNYGGITSIPTTFIIDRNLNIIQKAVGYHNKEFFLEYINNLK